LQVNIVVASLLLILGIKKEFIIEEYLLSEGEVSVDLINAALAGIGEPREYFKKLDLDKIRKNIISK
jgi:protein-tyrosine phosphatase